MTLPPFDNLAPACGDWRDLVIIAAAVIAFIGGMLMRRLRGAANK